MSFRNFPVRTGFVLVLALFGALILTIGMLGVFSLQRNNALSSTVSTQDAEVIYLKDVYIDNLRARSALARAYIALGANAGAGSKEEDAAIAAAAWLLRPRQTGLRIVRRRAQAQRSQPGSRRARRRDIQRAYGRARDAVCRPARRRRQNAMPTSMNVR